MVPVFSFSISPMLHVSSVGIQWAVYAFEHLSCTFIFLFSHLLHPFISLSRFATFPDKILGPKRKGRFLQVHSFSLLSLVCLPLQCLWDWTSQWGPCGRFRDETEDLGIFYRNKFQKEGGGPRDFWVILTPGRTSLFIRLIWVTDLTSNTDYISWRNICSSGVEEPVSSVRSESLLLDGTYANHQLI